MPTIKRMEAGDGPIRGNYENVAAVLAVLEASGIEFIPENGGGPGVRLRKPAAAPAESAGEFLQNLDSRTNRHTNAISSLWRRLPPTA